jgi:hypothetical protein
VPADRETVAAILREDLTSPTIAPGVRHRCLPWRKRTQSADVSTSASNQNVAKLSSSSCWPPSKTARGDSVRAGGALAAAFQAADSHGTPPSMPAANGLVGSQGDLPQTLEFMRASSRLSRDALQKWR